MDGKGLSTPEHAASWSSTSWMARSSNAGPWHWTQWDVLFGSQEMNCSSTTLSRMASASLPPTNNHFWNESQSCCAKTKGLSTSDLLDNGSFKVSVHQEVDRKLLGSFLGFPQQQWNQPHRPAGRGPLTRLCCPLKQIQEGLWVIRCPHLGERHVSSRDGTGGSRPRPDHPVQQAPEPCGPPARPASSPGTVVPDLPAIPAGPDGFLGEDPRAM